MYRRVLLVAESSRDTRVVPLTEADQTKLQCDRGCMDMAGIMDQLQNIGSDAQSILFIFMFVLLLVWSIQNFKANRGLPPGPWGFPILGYLPLLGKNPHLTLTSLYKKYGPVFRIQMGSRPTVVINGYAAIKEALLDKGFVFAGRPDFESFGYIARGTSFAFQSYGPRWRLHHRITATGLRMFSTNRNPPIDDVINEEAQQLVEDLLRGENGVIDPAEHVDDAVASIILAICFGSRYEYRDDPFFKAFNKTTDEFTRFQSAGGNPGDMLPWASALLRGKLQRFIDTNENLLSLVLPRIREHQKTFQEDNLRDTMDALIKAAKDISDKDKETVGLSEEAILFTVTTLIGAGVTTVATSIKWAILYMAYYPEIQEKVQKEIDDVIGHNRHVTSADRGSLVYTEACILEIFRHSTIAPLAIPHSTLCDTDLCGYRIPKNTMVFVNLWSVSYDEATWESPSDFSPERFLAKDGLSINKELAEKGLPFGLGKRRCIGEFLARLEVFQFFVTLLQRCKFSVSPDNPITFEATFGLALDPKPYKIAIKARD